jgi:hypothetical protein
MKFVNSVDISSLSDEELLQRMEVLVQRARSSTADVVEHLAEIDRRGLCPKKEYGSLYDYCVHRLRMSEGSAYRRIRAARAFRAFPPLMNMLRDGRLSLESLAILHPFASDPDIAILATKAAGMKTRQLEALLAERQDVVPQNDVIRFGATGPSAPLTPQDAGESLFAVPREIPVTRRSDNVPTVSGNGIAQVQAVEPARSVRIAFTADEEFYRLLERVRALMRHKYPDGRLEGVLRDALKALLERKDPLIRWKATATRRRPASPASGSGSRGALRRRPGA